MRHETCNVFVLNKHLVFMHAAMCSEKGAKALVISGGIDLTLTAKNVFM